MFKRSLLLMVFVTGLVQALDLMQMPEYSNVITEIQEIHGGSTYSLILKCQQQEPIINYAPASYEESMSNEIYRSFMPGTTLADGVSDSSGVIEQVGSGIEIILLGRLKEKIVGDYTVILIVEI